VEVLMEEGGSKTFSLIISKHLSPNLPQNKNNNPPRITQKEEKEEEIQAILPPFNNIKEDIESERQMNEEEESQDQMKQQDEKENNENHQIETDYLIQDIITKNTKKKDKRTFDQLQYNQQPSFVSSKKKKTKMKNNNYPISSTNNYSKVERPERQIRTDFRSQTLDQLFQPFDKPINSKSHDNKISNYNQQTSNSIQSISNKQEEEEEEEEEFEVSMEVPGAFAFNLSKNSKKMKCLCCGLQNPSHPIKTSLIKEEEEEESKNEISSSKTHNIQSSSSHSSSSNPLPSSLPRTKCDYDSIQNFIKEIESGSKMVSDGGKVIHTTIESWKSSVFVGRISSNLSLIQQGTNLLLLNHYNLMFILITCCDVILIQLLSLFRKEFMYQQAILQFNTHSSPTSFDPPISIQSALSIYYGGSIPSYNQVSFFVRFKS